MAAILASTGCQSDDSEYIMGDVAPVIDQTSPNAQEDQPNAIDGAHHEDGEKNRPGHEREMKNADRNMHEFLRGDVITIGQVALPPQENTDYSHEIVIGTPAPTCELPPPEETNDDPKSNG